MLWTNKFNNHISQFQRSPCCFKNRTNQSHKNNNDTNTCKCTRKTATDNRRNVCNRNSSNTPKIVETKRMDKNGWILNFEIMTIMTTIARINTITNGTPVIKLLPYYIVLLGRKEFSTPFVKISVSFKRNNVKPYIFAFRITFSKKSAKEIFYLKQILKHI